MSAMVGNSVDAIEKACDRIIEKVEGIKLSIAEIKNKLSALEEMKKQNEEEDWSKSFLEDKDKISKDLLWVRLDVDDIVALANSIEKATLLLDDEVRGE